jgi:hypothetical protein
MSASERRVGLARITRRHVLTAAGVLVFIALLFPPWIAYRAPTAGYASTSFAGRVSYSASDAGYSVPIGWSFVLVAPPARNASVAIDWSRLTIELLLIGAATALGLYTLPGARRQAVSAPGSGSTL